MKNYFSSLNQKRLLFRIPFLELFFSTYRRPVGRPQHVWVRDHVELDDAHAADQAQGHGEGNGQLGVLADRQPESGK